MGSPPPAMLSDGKAFSLPATAHGLQGRFNARTVTKRKYPGHVPVPVGPALLHLWHEPDRSLCFIETVFSKSRGRGGPVTQRISLRIRVPFYSVFDLHEKVVRVAIERGLRHLEKILKKSL